MDKKIVPFAAAAAALVLAAGVLAGQAASAQQGPLASIKSTRCSAYHPGIPGPAQFVSKIDNPYFPLPAGRTLVYRGTKDGMTQVDRVHVTSKTRTIQGVTARTVRDVARHGRHLLEKTRDWYAQDDNGNVWYLGEATKSFEGGKVDTSGSWLWGKDNAKPGVIMEGTPHVPDSYRQECLQGEAEDMAWVVTIGGSTKVPYGVVHRVLRTFEFARIEPNVVDQKLYGPGVGIVAETTMHGAPETSFLVRVRH